MVGWVVCLNVTDSEELETVICVKHAKEKNMHYGRIHVPEPPHLLQELHFHDWSGPPLKEVDNEVPLDVLDQSDLESQGIFTTKFIPGCKENVKALGSCTANTAVEALSKLLPSREFVEFVCLDHTPTEGEWHPYNDTDFAEAAAVYFYYLCTHQTGDPASEWPPTDCGSSGLYVVDELTKLGFIKGAKIATAGLSLLSLMQKGPVMLGTPFFFSWEEPNAQGFIDEDGSLGALEKAIHSGVAGGHEITLTAIESLGGNPVLRFRNHWGRSWGDAGCGRIHLNTLKMLGNYIDLRQLYL